MRIALVQSRHEFTNTNLDKVSEIRRENKDVWLEIETGVCVQKWGWEGDV